MKQFSTALLFLGLLSSMVALASEEAVQVILADEKPLQVAVASRERSLPMTFLTREYESGPRGTSLQKRRGRRFTTRRRKRPKKADKSAQADILTREQKLLHALHDVTKEEVLMEQFQANIFTREQPLLYGLLAIAQEEVSIEKSLAQLLEGDKENKKEHLETRKRELLQNKIHLLEHLQTAQVNE